MAEIKEKKLLHKQNVQNLLYRLCKLRKTIDILKDNRYVYFFKSKAKYKKKTHGSRGIKI